MSRLTLGELKYELGEILDVCEDSEDIPRYVNRANQLIWAHDSYTSEQDRICLDAPNCCFLLPFEYEAVHTAAIGTTPVSIRNRHFEFADAGAGLGVDCCGCEQEIHDRGVTRSTFFDMPSAMRVLALSDRAEDADTTISIQGLDQYGKDVFSDGMTGETLKLIGQSNGILPQSPKYTQSEFSRIDAVIKPITKGFVYLYAYNVETQERYFLSRYHPREINPCYRQYAVGGNPCDCQVTVMASRRRMPVCHDNDIMLVNLPLVYEYFVRALLLEEDMENPAAMQSASMFKNKARGLLNSIRRKQKGGVERHVNFDKFRSPNDSSRRRNLSKYGRKR